MHPLTERLLGALALSTVGGLGCSDTDVTPTVLLDAAGSGGTGGLESGGTGGLESGGTGGLESGGTGGSAGSLPVADRLFCTCSSNTVCVLPEAVPISGSSVPSECPAASNVYTGKICPSTSYGGVRVSDLVRQGPYCCYTLHTQGCVGRPLVVNGELRTSRVVRRDDWRTSMPAPAIGLSVTVRARLAEAWLEDALFEHASVAAFARFTLELVALGAPVDLVRDATAAALDEVEHAKLCFSLASRYAEKTLGPTALDVGGALSTRSLAELAVATFHEGCVGETLAALVASEQLAGAGDALVSAALAKIADDEARHAELAWRTVKWALDEGGAQVRAALENALSALLLAERAVVTNECSGADSDEWRVHGRLSRAELESVRQRGLREVVVPCVRALLSAFPDSGEQRFEFSALIGGPRR